MTLDTTEVEGPSSEAIVSKNTSNCQGSKSGSLSSPPRLGRSFASKAAAPSYSLKVVRPTLRSGRLGCFLSSLCTFLLALHLVQPRASQAVSLPNGLPWAGLATFSVDLFVMVHPAWLSHLATKLLLFLCQTILPPSTTTVTSAGSCGAHTRGALSRTSPMDPQRDGKC